MVHEVEFDGPRVGNYVVSAASGNGIDCEAEQRRAKGQGSGVSLVEHGVEEPVASNDVEVDVGVEVGDAAGERAAQDHSRHPSIIPKVVHRPLQQGAMGGQ
jgi:hypothetical protein